VGSCEHEDGRSGSVKCGEFRDRLHKKHCFMELASGVALWWCQTLSETQVPGELILQDSVSVYW
jgi:hypothetical protein